MNTLDGELRRQTIIHHEKIFMKTQQMKMNYNNDNNNNIDYLYIMLTIIFFCIFYYNTFEIQYIHTNFSILFACILSSIYIYYRPHKSLKNKYEWTSCTYSDFNILIENYAKGFRHCGVNNEYGKTWVLWRKQNDNIHTVAMVCGLMRAGGAFVLIDPRATGFYGMLKILKETPPDFVFASEFVCCIISIFSWFFRLPTFQYISSTSLLLHGGLMMMTTNEDKLDNNKKELRKDMISQSFVNENTIAGVMFTSGSTGLPKNIHLSQSTLVNQAKAYGKLFWNAIKNNTDDSSSTNNNNYNNSDIMIKILQTTFNFPLFDYVNGFTSILPVGDFNNVQNLNVEKFYMTMKNQKVNAAFVSPSVWKRLLIYCENTKQEFPTSVKFTASGGAPLHPTFHEKMIRLYNSKIKPYGEHISVYAMTEGLPLASIGSREVLHACNEWTKIGGGICLGKPVTDLKVKIIPLSFTDHDDDDDQKSIHREQLLQCPNFDIIIAKHALYQQFGEISVRGNMLTHDQYHNTGDVGYIDLNDRIWLCGRKAHIIHTKSGHILSSVAFESIVNYLPYVKQSAIALNKTKLQKDVVLFVEPIANDILIWKINNIVFQLKTLLKKHKLLKYIDEIRILDFNCELPTDPRHRSKIYRNWSKLTASNIKFQEIVRTDIYKSVY